MAQSAEQQLFLEAEKIDFSQLSQDEIESLQSKRLSSILRHGGLWQATWCGILSIFQGVSTFHIFTFVFQVSTRYNHQFSHANGMNGKCCSSRTDELPLRIITFTTYLPGHKFVYRLIGNVRLLFLNLPL